MTNIFVDQFVLELQISITEKIPDQHYSLIPVQEINYWSTEYLELTIKDKSWYNNEFLEPVSNNASSSSPFNAAAIAYFNILIFCYFDVFFDNYFPFKQSSCFLNSNFHVARLCSFHHVFLLCWSQKLIWKQLLKPINSWMRKVCAIKCLPLKIGA